MIVATVQGGYVLARASGSRSISTRGYAGCWPCWPRRPAEGADPMHAMQYERTLAVWTPLHRPQQWL